MCGCECDLAVTSVTLLIALVDLAGWLDIPFLPHGSLCLPPELHAWSKRMTFPVEEECFSVKGTSSWCSPARNSQQALRAHLWENVG